MKTKNLWLLLLSLTLCVGSILIDRFVAPIPQLLSFTVVAIAIVTLIIFMVQNKNNLK